MRRRRGIVSRLLLVSLFGACLLGAPAFAGAETTTSVHVPRHRSAESLLPVARAALGEEGSATVDGDALILVGSPDAVERTADLLRARDRAQPLITLEVESRTERWLRAAGYEIRWESTATDFALGRLAGPASGPQRGRIYRSGRDERQRAVIRVRSGETGRIELSEVVPLRARGFWGGETRIVDYPSGLEATPRLLGNGRVELELSWSEAEVSPGGRASLGRLATTVDVQAGQSVVLGGRGRRVGAERARRLGTQRSREADEQLIWVHVDVAPVPQEPASVSEDPRSTDGYR